MSISIDVRKYTALEKKRDKLQSRVKDVALEISNLRDMYDMVGAGALKLFDDAVTQAHEKQTRRASEGA